MLQVAPSARNVQLRAERWDTDAQHHGYIDPDSNRCERVTIAAGASRRVYEAEVLLSAPGDRIAPARPLDAPELLAVNVDQPPGRERS